MDFSEPDSKPDPKYWNLLSEEDREDYRKLRQTLSSPSCKNRRNHSIETFREVVSTIKSYVQKDDENEWKRSLVCGIIWLSDTIAINTHQLRLLTSKCKSSINGSFQALGYGTVPTGADSCGELIKKYSFMKNKFSELRQWTVRQMLSQSPQPKRLADLIPNKKKTPVYVTPPPDLKKTISIDEFEIGNTYEVNLPDVYDDLKLPIESDPLCMIPDNWLSPSRDDSKIIPDFLAGELEL